MHIRQENIILDVVVRMSYKGNVIESGMYSFAVFIRRKKKM